VADQATEVANLAREAADGATEMADQATEVAIMAREAKAGKGSGRAFQKTFLQSPPVLGTVGIGILPSPARLGYLPSAGTSLLDNKRGVSAARPHGG
jgi:hypothetical protein